MQTLMRSAAAAGGTFVGDVRLLAAISNLLISSIQNFGFDYHYIRVASRTGFWSDKFVTSVLPVTSYQAPVSSREVPVVIGNQPFSRCMVNFRSDEYDIRVYIKWLGKNIINQNIQQFSACKNLTGTNLG